MSDSANVLRLPTLTESLSDSDCRLLLEGLRDQAVAMLDRDGRVVGWTPGAEQIEGYAAREILGKTLEVFFTPDDVAAGLPARVLERAASEGRVELEGPRIRKGGETFWAAVVVTALRDPSGALQGFARVTRDLTERRAAEQRLRRSEERFHRVIDAITDYAIFMLDADGNVQTWNAGARALKGYEEAEIVGHHFSAFYTAEDRAQGLPETILETVRREGRFEDERWRIRKDGTLFWANVVITALRDEHGEIVGFAKVTRDLTKRRAAEETQRELLRAQAQRSAAELVARRAEEANRIKDEFLATVSHELRTPLNAVVGWAAMLREQALPPTAARAIEIIDRNARAQVRIIEDILDMSRIITGKLRIEPELVDVAVIARQTVDVVAPSAAARQVDLQLDASPSEVLLVADPNRLQQIMWNLLSNAVKFTDSGGSVLLTVRMHGTKVVVCVTDTGRGIAPEFLPHVFERFRQADSSTTRTHGGLGLGLSLVRHLVELHGGTVRAESIGVGGGATFTVELPVRSRTVSTYPEAVATSEPVVVEPRRATRELEGLRVLVVDDEPDALQLAQTVLEGAGAETAVASSVNDGLALVRSFRPHVIVSDIAMPNEDGFALVRRLRESASERGGAVIPTIALTAYTRSEDRTKALAAGFTTHIGKPVEPNDLVRAVTNLAALAPR